MQVGIVCTKGKLELSYVEISGTRAGRNSGPARAVLFANLGSKIETSSAGLVNYQIGGRGVEILR